MAGPPLTLKFTDLEDFHPDNLFRRVQLFQKLRDTREKLSDPETFATASAMGFRVETARRRPSWMSPMDMNQTVQHSIAGNLLDQMVAETEK